MSVGWQQNVDQNAAALSSVKQKTCSSAYHRQPPTINHHQPSSTIINHHQPSSTIINHHQPS